MRITCGFQYRTGEAKTVSKDYMSFMKPVISLCVIYKGPSKNLLSTAPHAQEEDMLH